MTCDRCPAIGRVRAVYDTGGELWACYHHAREWWPEDRAYDGITFEYQTVEVGAI